MDLLNSILTHLQHGTDNMKKIPIFYDKFITYKTP